MDRKKRILALVILLSLFFAMGVPAGAVEKKLVWTWCCGQADRAMLFTRLAEDYMARHPGVEIEAVYPAGNYADVLMTWIAAGVGPDVMWLGTEFWRFIDGNLLSLNKLMTTGEAFGSVHPGMLRQNFWQGEQLGIPYGANTHTLALNKELFEAAGLNFPGKDLTWGQAIDMAKRLTVDRDGDGIPEQWGINITEYTAHPFLYGGDFYTADGKSARIANRANMEAVQLYADMRSGKLGVFPVGVAGTGPAQLMSRTTAMVNIGIFNVPELRNSDLDWDVVNLPALEVDGQRYRSTFMSGEAWGIYAGTQHPQEAMDFVEFLMSDEAMKLIAETGIVIPTQAKIGEQYFVHHPPPPSNLVAFLDALDHGSQLSFLHPVGMEVQQQIQSTRLWADLWDGHAPAETVLPEFQRLANAVLSRYWSGKE